MSLVDAQFCARGKDVLGMELSNMMEHCHLATMANNYLTVRFHVRTGCVLNWRNQYSVHYGLCSLAGISFTLQIAHYVSTYLVQFTNLIQ